MIEARLRMTRSVGSEKSTSMPNPSRLKSLSAFASQKPAGNDPARSAAGTAGHPLPGRRMISFDERGQGDRP